MKLDPLTRRFRDLPLAWKILVPYLVLVLIVGAAGGSLVVRSLSTRAQTALDDQLSRRLLDVRSALHERELYLLESADYAANIQGVAAAVGRLDNGNASRLLGSVIGLKPELAILVVTDLHGRGVAELTRSNGHTSIGTGSPWGAQGVVHRALAARNTRAVGGRLVVAGKQLLAVVTPVCSAAPDGGCRPVGVAIAGLPLDAVAQAARPADTQLALFDDTGRLLYSDGRSPGPPTANLADGLVRVGHRGKEETQSLYGPFLLQGQSLGSVAVTVPAAPAFASVRGTSKRLLLLLALAMVGVIGIGALLSRSILRQLRPLVATNRRLGSGDLGARVEVLADDEIGELGRGLNQMADQLQAAVTTLSVRAEQNAEEVQRLLHERTVFFASLSHEFRTPLAVIRAQADLLLRRTDGRRSGDRMSLSIVKDAANQALEIVNEVLELARADAGSVEVNLQSVSVAAVMEELRATFLGLAAAADLDGELQPVTNLPPVHADPRRVRQILLNLMDNAVKYSPPGGTVRVTAAQKGDMVQVTVTDTGIGIPAQDLGTLFQPFARVPGSTPQAGQASTGLGLSLCRQLVEAQGGEIFVDSNPRGTSFRFTLPIFRAPQGGVLAPDDARVSAQ